MPPGSWRWLEEPELLAYDFDAQAFLLAAHDVHGGEFAALDTLQHGLAGHAERAYRFAHRKKVVAGLAGEAGPEIFGQSDPPRGAGCQLLAGDDSIIEQAAALFRMPPLRRARSTCNSASLIVPLSPSNRRSLNSAG